MGAICLGNHTSDTISFRRGSSEMARFNNTGTFLIGTTDSTPFNKTSGDGVAIKGEEIQVASENNCLALNHSDGDGDIAKFFRAGTQVGGITVASSSTTYATSSDARLKDVTGSARGLEVINKLNPVAYNWKVDGKADEGLIAQEVLDVVPNAVSGSEVDMYQMDYSKLVVHLVAGIKEQQEQIDALQSEINELKNS
jgi:putative lipoic acid-binding regulatory protein